MLAKPITYTDYNGVERTETFYFNLSQAELIDMQLGGSWVGAVDPSRLPVEMEIDWVKHYQPRKK